MQSRGSHMTGASRRLSSGRVSSRSPAETEPDDEDSSSRATASSTGDWSSGCGDGAPYDEMTVTDGFDGEGVCQPSGSELRTNLVGAVRGA